MVGFLLSIAMASHSSTSSSCPICLQPLREEAYLDNCFHSFCYECIMKWFRFVNNKSKTPLVSIKCPLCKSENISIIHGFNGENFQRHFFNQQSEKRSISDANDFRLRFYTHEVDLPRDVFDVQQYWKRHEYLKKNTWLQNWLKREIQTLMQDENIDIIVHHINGVIESFFRRLRESTSKGKPEERHNEFRLLLAEAAKRFLKGQTECFVDQVELFLASGLNISAYDKVCMQHLSVGRSDHNGDFDDQIEQEQYLNFLDEDVHAED